MRLHRRQRLPARGLHLASAPARDRIHRDLSEVSATRATVVRGVGALLLLGLAASSPGCIKRGYPLSRSGAVDVRLDVSSALFAADTLDATGKPTGLAAAHASRPCSNRFAAL